MGRLREGQLGGTGRPFTDVLSKCGGVILLHKASSHLGQPLRLLSKYDKPKRDKLDWGRFFFCLARSAGSSGLKL